MQSLCLILLRTKVVLLCLAFSDIAHQPPWLKPSEELTPCMLSKRNLAKDYVFSFRWWWWPYDPNAHVGSGYELREE